MDEYRAYAMAKASVTTLRDPKRVLPLAAPGPDLALAVVLDDDDREGREAPVREREEFRAGVIRRTGREAGGVGEVLAAAAVAERVVVALYGDIRAWKGRPGLSPALEDLLGRIAAAAGERMVAVAFGPPALAAAAGEAAAVCAWDDAPLVQRAALDLLLGGRSPTARPPYGPDPLS